MGGCAATVDLRPLATGRVEVEAFELRGPDLAVLRREASRRCPQGADVLRQAESGRPADEPVDGRISRWMTQAAAWVDPPQHQAQLMVVCRPDPQRLTLASPAPAAPIPTADAAMLAALRQSRYPYGEGPPADEQVPAQRSRPAPPIGPIDPTW